MRTVVGIYVEHSIAKDVTCRKCRKAIKQGRKCEVIVYRISHGKYICRYQHLRCPKRKKVVSKVNAISRLKIRPKQIQTTIAA